MVAASDPYPDPAANDQRYVVVDVELGKRLTRPVELRALKAEPAFEGSELVRIPRLSVVPLTSAQWRAVLAFGRG